MPRLDGLQILVVDDQADGRMLTSLVLTQAGASEKMVASAKEALRVLDAERPDVVVSDIDLPDEDGYTLIRQIRQHEAEHGGFLPAVALTGYARGGLRANPRRRIPGACPEAHRARRPHGGYRGADAQHAPETRRSVIIDVCEARARAG